MPLSRVVRSVLSRLTTPGPLLAIGLGATTVAASLWFANANRALTNHATGGLYAFYFLVGTIGTGVLALGIYGFVATLQPDAEFGRVLAAYGGVFVAGSIAWGMAADGYRPDRWDVIGALVCLAGMAVIMYAPRGR